MTRPKGGETGNEPGAVYGQVGIGQVEMQSALKIAVIEPLPRTLETFDPRRQWRWITT